MKLTIKNFSRIKEAEINIYSIIIIAGENNTGKTTVGKVLFSCFNSFNNLEKEIYLDREFSVQKELYNLHDLLVEYKINNCEEYGLLGYILERFHFVNLCTLYRIINFFAAQKS